MNLLEFKDLIEWVTTEIVAKQIPQKYQQLSNTLTKNLQPNQQSQALKPFRDALDSALNDMNMEALNTLQYKKLIDLEVGNYFGEEGKLFVQNEFINNPHDLKVVSDNIAKAFNDINTFVAKINHMKTYAEYFVTSEIITEEHKNVLRIIYKNEVSINSLEDLKKRTADLYAIMRSFAAIGDQNPSNIELVSVENGSVVFDFIIAGGIILPIIYKSVKAVLEISILNYDRKIKIKELEKLEMDVSSPKASLKEAEEGALDTIYESIISLLDKEVPQEVKGQLKTSVKKLHQFIEGGGEIDIVNPEVTEESGTVNEELETLITEVRRLYKKEQKLIAYKKENQKKK